MFSLESPHRGVSNKYTQFTIFSITKKITLNYPKSAAVGFFLGTQEGWLVGCFGFNGPLRQYFSLYRATSQREGERGEKIAESKNVQTPPPAPTASAIGPCPTIIQIVGRPGTGSLSRTFAPPDHPRLRREYETALVNESSVFEPLKFYCILDEFWNFRITSIELITLIS